MNIYSSRDFLCSACHTQSLEERDSELVCSSCGKTYAIQNGIVFLYDQLSPAAQAESRAAEEELAEKNIIDFENEKWILNYLDNEKLGIDSRTDRLRRVSSENAVAFLDRVMAKGKKRILEIGAGNCWLTAHLAERHDCVALDICVSGPRGLEAGEIFLKNRPISFERVVADMIRLPFADSSFDAVIFCAALHHSSDLEITLAEVHRVLTPDGTLFLASEPSVGIFGSQERERVARDFDAGFHEGRYSVRQWRRSLGKAGFAADVRLPENMLAVLATSTGFRRLIGLFLAALPDSICRLFLTLSSPFILTLFDGFINITAQKTRLD